MTLPEPGQPFPPGYFRRQDESDDPAFYVEPRLVVHIDEPAIAAIGDFFQEVLPPQGMILDLMSSWRSHLPPGCEEARLVGLGLNAVEMAENPQLNQRVVHDVNADPVLPFPDATFDAAMVTVSIQYLIRPVEVLRSVANVLRPGGRICIAVSHRMFPTKAILAFRQLEAAEKIRLVATYLQSSGYEKVDFIDRSPSVGDPLWLLVADVASKYPRVDFST